MAQIKSLDNLMSLALHDVWRKRRRLERLLFTRLATRSRTPMERHRMYVMSMKMGCWAKRLVAAKSRLAPLKAMSILRLGHMGALDNIEDLCGIGDTQKQSDILGRQCKCWFLGPRTKDMVKISNRLHFIELEKFMMILVYTNGGTLPRGALVQEF